MERLEQAAVFLAVVSLFLSCLMPTLPSADPRVSRLPLVALLGELGSGLLPGVYLSSCILICVLAHSLSRKRLSELISSAPCQKCVVRSSGKRA